MVKQETARSLNVGSNPTESTMVKQHLQVCKQLRMIDLIRTFCGLYKLLTIYCLLYVLWEAILSESAC